jgi:GNAT superfamily N-acetyltransferase
VGEGSSRLPATPVQATLRDGTAVVARPIRPEDKALVRRGFARLSAESRYRRFMAPLTELSDEQLAFLTEVDGVDHVAWVATRADEPEEGMGVGRWVRMSEDPTVAEAALTVIDEYQGRGLGTFLVGLLAASARAAGVTMFRAYVLEENVRMRELLDELGARSEHDSPGLVRIDVPLEPEMLPDSAAGRILRAVAARALSPVAPRLIM